MNNNRLGFALLLVFGAGALCSGNAPAQAPLEITYVANEGFLLQAGEDRVLIDALQRGGVPGYEVPPSSVLNEMESAAGSFAGLDVALSSHSHRDHFDAETVARYLQADRSARYLSTSEMTEAVRQHLTAGRATNQIETAPYPPVPERSDHQIGTIRVEIFRLNHTGFPGERYRLQNLGQLITIGGWKILHVGDAAMDEAIFAPHRLAEENIDVALIPFWYWMDETGRKIVGTHIRAARTVAVHIPPEDLTQVRDDLHRQFPAIVFFSEPMQTRTFQDP